MIPLRWMTSFLSTLSLRRATDRSWRKQSNHHKFLSTLSLRRATRIEPDQVPGYTISIHALLAESDPRFRFAPLPAAYFYPRSPCGERLLTAACIFLSMPFLSTLSLRRATYGTLIYSNGKAYFYPRSPCGERRPAHGCIGSADNISIHALLAESDVLFPPFFCFAAISIHALLAESDTYAPEYRPETEISIHALLAESDVRAAHTRTLTLKFLSTLSLRRATEQSASYNAYLEISIHALLAESDRESSDNKRKSQAFLSTLSLRRATVNALKFAGSMLFLSTLSLRRATNAKLYYLPVLFVFLSTLSLRRATAKVHKTVGHFCAYETNFMGIASSC